MQTLSNCRNKKVKIEQRTLQRLLKKCEISDILSNTKSKICLYPKLNLTNHMIISIALVWCFGFAFQILLLHPSRGFKCINDTVMCTVYQKMINRFNNDTAMCTVYQKIIHRFSASRKKMRFNSSCANVEDEEEGSFLAASDLLQSRAVLFAPFDQELQEVAHNCYVHRQKYTSAKHNPAS